MILSLLMLSMSISGNTARQYPALVVLKTIERPVPWYAEDVVRLGMGVAEGTMNQDDVLKWIMKNRRY